MDKEVLPPNEMLKNARLKADWSLSRVAFALNLPSHTIESLENGQYADLHGEAFVTGYMKSYAELFDLDGESLVQLYKDQQAEIAESMLANEALKQSSNAQHKKFGTFYGVAAAVTLMAALSMISPAPQQVDADTDSISVETSIGTTTIDSLELMPEQEPTKGLIPDVSWSNQVSADQASALVKQRVFGEAGTTSSDSLTSDLNFSFSADCWVEITDGDNNLIYSSLQKANDDLQLTGKPPFQITLGYAPGVSLSYNGQPVSIDTSKTNIAKLVLGNS